MRRRRLLPHLWCCFLFLLGSQISYGQSRSVTGTVTDEKGAPLLGATVLVKNTKNNVTTNASGQFELLAPANVKTLVVSYVGYETREVAIPSGNQINIILKAADANLDAIVVVGYGTQKRTDVTGAVGSVKGDAIKNMPVTNVTDAIQGRV
ncbi:MAG TPA: carboxypeptidase-like regulatory domain-containing protein, partial [Niastella sp.]